MALNAGGGSAAVYSGGSGTATLTFLYSVAAGQSVSGLDYTSTAALALDGGAIRNAASDAAILALPTTGVDGLATDIAIDALPPTITSVAITSVIAGQKYSYQVKAAAMARRDDHLLAQRRAGRHEHQRRPGTGT